MIEKVKCKFCGASKFKKPNYPNWDADDVDWIYGKVLCSDCGGLGNIYLGWSKGDLEIPE